MSKNNDNLEAFKAVTAKNYVDQAKFFLNAYFDDVVGKGEGENVWNWVNKFIELDKEKGKSGDSLDEFSAHRFLEQIGETLRVVELRETLREIDLDFNKRMAVVEFLVYRYKKTITELLKKPQGDSSLLQVAEDKLRTVSEAFDKLQIQLAEQKEIEENARVTLAAQRKAEESVKAAEAELRTAVDSLSAEEKARADKIADLEQKSTTGSSQVAKSKAAAELAQAKQEDPLPLRKAKLTQEAALKKVEKERKAAEAASAKSEAAQRDAEQKTREVEAAVVETEKALEEAKQYLEDVKKNAVPRGSIWWMERELEEKQKYLPKKKQNK
eukprot:TRINITY_DN896_c0_g1_i1.p1 TRINITY_DN896_c0_g1~~TRINITY_DN896_c0_g1_i1.p1  ORF type:complete len:327 (+),score=129.98 TRINITY_DN896_c0_g1_i1:205-1185(+)